MTYLLDTCSFIWLCAEPGRLSGKARGVLSSPGVELLLSDVSVLEIVLKWGAGKLDLPAPPRRWITEQAGYWHTSPLPVTRSMIYRSSELPDHHRDPFDRLLVAAALESDVPLVTPDDSVRRYPVECIW